MSTGQQQQPSKMFGDLKGLLGDLENIYKDIHSHPELSMQEQRTASIAADHLRRAGYEVTTGVGGTGVVGLLRNGDGPTVMLRADMDALPVKEATGLPYASSVTATDSEGHERPVMHACGHDMHVTWLIGAATLMAQHRDAWHGTLMPVFQPAEETAQGAQVMIDDDLFQRFPKPDVVLGQHVMVGSAGVVSSRPGVVTSAGDSLQIRMFGRGAHGSMPQASIDPVVMAASTVLRLQTIVSRELAPNEPAVVTIGALQAGTKENVIPDEAVLKLNVRTYDEGVRKRVLAAIERIVNAEAEASGAPKKPEITKLDQYALVKNDPGAVQRVGDAFRKHFSSDRVQTAQPTAASEDFGSFRGRMGFTSRLLVRRRHGSRHVRRRAKGRHTGRTSHESQSKVCAGHSPDAGNRGGSARVRGAGLARVVNELLVHGKHLAGPFLIALDLIGTFVFALSGAAAGVKSNLDLFGLMVLAFATGNAGGIMRDLLIGAVPPAAIQDWHYLAVCLAAALVTFWWYPKIDVHRRPVLLFDAVGLALFAVTGTQKALAAGLNPAMAAVMGMLSGVGGGILRDILVNETPTVLRADLYAVAALAAGALVVAGHLLQLPAYVGMLTGAGLCCWLRVMAIFRGWHLPTAKGS